MSRGALGRRTLMQVQSALHHAGFDVVRGTFRHRFLYALHQQGIDAVLDIGANAGQFGTSLRRAGYPGRIVSVEPLAAAFGQLQRRCAADARWVAQRAAVAQERGTLAMNVSANSVSSSVLPVLERSVRAAPETTQVRTEQVPATTVDDLFRDHGLDPTRTLLKVDVQGLEREVLAGAAGVLPTVAAVRTEMSLVPLYDGQALMPEIVDVLGISGLELWHLEPGFTDPVTRRLLQVDGSFFRGGRPGS